MTDRESCTHHFEHVKQTRPFTEREYMQCTKCGHQNPLGLFQHWDTERDGPVPMPDFNRNSYVYRTSIPQHMWPQIPEIIKLEPKKSAIDYLIEAFKAPFNQKPKREPIIAIRKDPDSPYYPWIWSCQICPGQPELGTNFDKCVDWQSALMYAGNHAHNHHRSGK